MLNSPKDAISEKHDRDMFEKPTSSMMTHSHPTSNMGPRKFAETLKGFNITPSPNQQPSVILQPPPKLEVITKELNNDIGDNSNEKRTAIFG